MRSYSPLDEDLLWRLPLPLAQLYRRADNAKRPLDQHLNAQYLWEAMVKLLAIIALGAYAAQPEPAPGTRLAGLLDKLGRAPSYGDWWGLVQALLPPLAGRGANDFRRFADLFLTRKDRGDLPRAAGLQAALRERYRGKAGSGKTVNLPELFDLLVEHRNKSSAHGAMAQWSEDEHERLAGAMLLAAGEVLSQVFPPLPGPGERAPIHLLYVSEVRWTAGVGQVTRFELRGESARRLPSLEWPREQTDRLPESDQVYLELAGAADGGPASLHPLLRYDPDAAQVFFLNTPRDRQAEYLCYTSGKVESKKGLGTQLQELLACVRGQPAAAGPPDPEGGPPGPEEEPAPDRRTLGEFELLSVLGQGGMGVVYRARQLSLGREVALKKLRHAGGVPEGRFRREIQALGRVEHPHLVKVFTSGTDANEWFYAMELVEGASLDAVCRKLATPPRRTSGVDLPTWQHAVSTVCDEARRAERPLEGGTVPGTVAAGRAPVSGNPPGSLGPAPATEGSYIRRMVELMRQVAGAAHALHEGRVIHRDIKPGNVMVTSDGTQAVLMDLGLARLTDAPEGPLTRPQQFVGTLPYASPEQVLAVGPLDRRSDVYSLGATLWELLTLRPLFEVAPGTSDFELMRRIQQDEPERLRTLNPAVSRDLEAVVRKCLAKKPEQRYATAQELADELQRILDNEPVRARLPPPRERLGRWARKRKFGLAVAGGVAAVLLLLAAVGGVRWYQDARLGHLVLTSDDAALVAEVLEEVRDRPVVPGFLLKSHRPTTLLPGEYRVRVAVPGRLSETYRVYLAAGQRYSFRVNLDTPAVEPPYWVKESAPGARAVVLPDLNGDGIPDLAYFGREAYRFTPDEPDRDALRGARLAVKSGKDGSPLRVYRAPYDPPPGINVLQGCT